jgi:hypothetical protein
VGVEGIHVWGSGAHCAIPWRLGGRLKCLSSWRTGRKCLRLHREEGKERRQGGCRDLRDLEQEVAQWKISLSA